MEGFVLQVFGPRMLKDGLSCANELGMKPFLVWGSLLGYIREKRFILHDRDIDMGLFSNEFEKKDLLKKMMLEKGYKICSDCPYYIAFAHPKWEDLLLDFLLFYAKDGFIETAEPRENKTLLYRYLFPKNIFDEFIKVNFEGSNVLIPRNAEELLSVTYGNWKTPRKHTNIISDYMNLKIEKVK